LITNYEVYPKIREQTMLSNIFNRRVDFDNKCAVLGDKRAKNNIRLHDLFTYFDF
jgi:hypothetical protein